MFVGVSNLVNLHRFTHKREMEKQQTGGGKKLFCEYCKKYFMSPSKLEIHIRTHTGEKSLTCETCFRQFSEAGSLRRHQLTHTGEKLSLIHI